MTGARREWDDPGRMLSVDDALHRILAAFSPLPPEAVPIVDALGMVLTSDVVARDDIPPFRNSAMDGYAVRSMDTVVPPSELSVVGSVAAGAVPTRHVGAGEAVRIMTGAALPDGADAVVRFEETDEIERPKPMDTISVGRRVNVGENVREPGEDIKAGSVALEAGTRLRPAEIGVLASLNHGSAKVHRRPRVAILATGDEIRDIGVDLKPGQLRNSNSSIVAAMARRFGGIPIDLGVAMDDTRDLKEKLAAAGTPDLFVTSGGVSVGDYDMVKDVLRSEGDIDIWQVRMKPGKPLAFGHIAGVPLIGLPGNPAAALVSFEQFGRPVLLKMLGRREISMPETTARLTERVENRGGRRHFVRGILTRGDSGNRVCQARPHGSAILTAVARSNCYIVVPETCDAIEPGSMVRVQLPDEGL